MPRPRTLNQREFEICKRLAVFRRGLGISRVEFARAVEIDSSQIARFELLRAPVRFDEACAVSSKFRVSLSWLATGKGFELDPSGAQLKSSEAFRNKGLLLSDVSDRLPESFGSGRMLLKRAQAHCRYLERTAASGALDHLSDETLDAINAVTLKAANEISKMQQEHPAAWRAIPVWFRPISKNSFDDTVSDAYSSTVKSEGSCWKHLQKRLIAATSQRGAKSALAQAFGVTQPAISQWLSGDNLPNAENTLRLLEWVTAAEMLNQKKTAAVLITPQRRMTRKSKSKTNEKTKSDRPEG